MVIWQAGFEEKWEKIKKSKSCDPIQQQQQQRKSRDCLKLIPVQLLILILLLAVPPPICASLPLLEHYFLLGSCSKWLPFCACRCLLPFFFSSSTTTFPTTLQLTNRELSILSLLLSARGEAKGYYHY